MKKNIVIISPYPKKGKYTHQSSALASFSKNLVNYLKSRVKLFIIADNDNLLDNAEKIWVKNDTLNYFKIIKKVLKIKNARKIIIQYEWGIFGKSIFFIALFPLFLFVLRLLGKQPIVVLHGVNFNFKTIFEKDKIKANLLNLGSYIFYILVCLISYKIIVTENYFKKQLQKLPFNKKNIVFIPHGVDSTFKFQKVKISEKLKLGYFGYLNIYKGPKILLDIFEELDSKKYQLTFYGGESPNLIKDKIYQSYIKSFYLKAKKIGVKITGFLKQNQLIKYLKDVNLVIFPYQIFISSSGMLALTFSFEKPFLLSRPLEKYFESPDFAQALKETGLKKEDLIFDLNKKSLEEKLSWARKNLKKLSQFSKIMKEKRSWEKVAKIYLEVIK
jgi:glycosyltransferase involved in cell wall biosynthesis